MLKRIGGLFLISIIGGRLLRWLIFPAPIIICLPYYYKYLVLFVCIIGGLMGYFIFFIYNYYLNIYVRGKKIAYFLGGMWFIPVISTLGIIGGSLKTGFLYIKVIDLGWNEFLGGQKIYVLLKNTSIIRQNFYINNLKIYILTFFFWVIVFIFLMVYLNSLYLERDIEDVNEVILLLNSLS